MSSDRADDKFWRIANEWSRRWQILATRAQNLGEKMQQQLTKNSIDVKLMIWSDFAEILQSKKTDVVAQPRYGCFTTKLKNEESALKFLFQIISENRMCEFGYNK